jgi:hypothetical protein
MFNVVVSNYTFTFKGEIMKRNTINFWIDLFTFIVLFAKIWTGLLVHYVLPPGQGRGHSLELWGLNRHEYGAVHFYLAIAMIVLVVIHVWLHWSWICTTLSGLLKIKKIKPLQISIVCHHDSFGRHPFDHCESSISQSTGCRYSR